MTRFTPALAAGALAGVLFFAHAMINNSHAWPLVWPLAGGAAAVWFAARRGRLHGFWSGLRAGAGAGVIASVLFFAATVAALAGLGLLSPERLNAVLLSLGVAAGLGVILATAAGALAYPAARLSPSHR
jgi:hypothetical protein